MGGQQSLRLQFEKEIKDQLFSEPTCVLDLRDLGIALEQLEESIERMLSFDANKGGSENSGRGSCVGEEGLQIRIRWIPALTIHGPRKDLGWAGFGYPGGVSSWTVPTQPVRRR